MEGGYPGVFGGGYMTVTLQISAEEILLILSLTAGIYRLIRN